MKIRNGYVSNSSSSSFIIACKGEDCVSKVKEAYHQLVDYWINIHPDDKKELEYANGEYIQYSSKDIINLLKDYFYDKEEENYLLNDLKSKEKDGYVFLLGSCSNEYNYPEYIIINMFNEYIVNSFKDKDGNRLDIEMIFNKRWS